MGAKSTHLETHLLMWKPEGSGGPTQDRPGVGKSWNLGSFSVSTLALVDREARVGCTLAPNDRTALPNSAQEQLRRPPSHSCGEAGMHGTLQQLLPRRCTG